FFRSGKKALMLVMEEAKLPPPIPASRPTSRNVVKEVPGSITANAATVGTSSRAADTIVQFRPPKTATAKVYGTRTTAPTSVTTDVSRNLSAGVRPYSGPMKSTRTDHIVQTEKPMCSDRTEKRRLRRAIRCPVRVQKVSSSGSHCWIQRPLGAVIGPPLCSGARTGAARDGPEGREGAFQCCGTR